MAGSAFGHDYRMDMEWSDEESFRQDNSKKNWIYIGVDTDRDGIAKIGLTTGGLGTRSSSSQNPYYAISCAFKIKKGITPDRVKEVEESAIEFLSKYYKRIPHKISGRPSEWFQVTHLEMQAVVDAFLYENFSREMHCYHCDIKDIGIIFSWANPDFLQGTSRPQYQANDLSSPAVDPDCYTQGGCGRDCDCWD